MKNLSLLVLLFFTFLTKAQPPGCSSGQDVLGNAGQSGLTGEYVSGYFGDNPSYFPATVATTNRVESNLNYTGNNWGAIVPPAGGTVADADNYSSRYRGSIYIATGGTYTFYLTSDDGSWMWIDNAALAYPTVVASALINNGGLHGDVTVAATLSLTAGLHNIQIQFGEQGGGNHLIFEYSATSPSITRQVVPNSILCTSIQPSITPVAVTAPPGCPCSAGVTSEFYANYFNDVQTFFTSNSPVINRTDPQIAFTTDGGWGNVCPPLAGTNASPETFSTRFTGRVYIATATTYTFYLTSDDASFMWLDGNALVTNPTAASAFINNGGLHSAATVSAVATLSVGLHDFKIHYGENTGYNICYLEYASTGAGLGRQYVPQASLCSCSSLIGLPIELLSFTAVLNGSSSVLLNWATATEINNKQFDIERSSNGIDFESIASVAAKGNKNGTSVTSYSYIDDAPLQGISYYRLKQIDLDGTFKIYKTVSVETVRNSKVLFSVFPNPNNGVFTLSLNGLKVHNSAGIIISSTDGRPVYERQLLKSDLAEDKQELSLDLNLAKGLYIATCVIDGVKYPVKMLVN